VNCYLYYWLCGGVTSTAGFTSQQPGACSSIYSTQCRKMSQCDVMFWRSHRVKSVSSTMRLHAIVCNECSPCKRTHPYHRLRNPFIYQADQLSQFATADIGGICAIIWKPVMVPCVDSSGGPRLSNCWLPLATCLGQSISSWHNLVSLMIYLSAICNDARKLNVLAMSQSIWLIQPCWPIVMLWI